MEYPKEYGNAEIGSRIREEREAKGLLQKDLAKLLSDDDFKCSKETVSKWEGGFRAVPADAILRLADCFKVTTDYLLCRTDTRSTDVKAVAAVEYTGLSEEAAEALRNLAMGKSSGELLKIFDEECAEVKFKEVLSKVLLSPAFASIVESYAEIFAMERYVSSLESCEGFNSAGNRMMTDEYDPHNKDWIKLDFEISSVVTRLEVLNLDLKVMQADIYESEHELHGYMIDIKDLRRRIAAITEMCKTAYNKAHPGKELHNTFGDEF